MGLAWIYWFGEIGRLGKLGWLGGKVGLQLCELWQVWQAFGVGKALSSSVGLVGLRLEGARWSGKMRKSPGQDDLHGEEEMGEH